MVYEEIVEGITRFFAVFHSTPVGPGRARSARPAPPTSTCWPSSTTRSSPGRAATTGVIKALQAADVATDLGASTGNNYRLAGYYRDSVPPCAAQPLHDHHASCGSLHARGRPAAAAAVHLPAPPGRAAAGATPVAGAKLTMAATRVLWQWDAGRRRLAAHAGRPPPRRRQRASRSRRQNVVIDVRALPQERRRPHLARGRHRRLGEAWVLTGGGVVTGRGPGPIRRSRPSSPTRRASEIG